MFLLFRYTILILAVYFFFRLIVEPIAKLMQVIKRVKLWVYYLCKHWCFCSLFPFQWNPKITTLPGLYLISVGMLGPVTAVLNLPVMELCTVYWLRGINVLFSFGNFYLIYALLKKLHNPVFVSTWIIWWRRSMNFCLHLRK